MSQNNLLIVKKFLNLQESGQLSEALSFVDENAVWHSDSINGPWSGSHYGKNEIIKHFKNIKLSVADFKKTSIDLTASVNSNVVYEYANLEVIFSHNNEFFKTPVVCIYEVKDSKILSYRVLEDSHNLYQIYNK
jgi:ketosteroid isomerase-like protein